MDLESSVKIHVDDSFATVSFYAGLLLAKLISVTVLISLVRLVTNIFANPEDAACCPLGKTSPPLPEDRMVLRLNRLLLSDLQDCLPFIFLAFMALATSPSQWMIRWICRAFFTARLLHTAAFIFQMDQPSRLLGYFISLCINVYLIFRIITTFALSQ